MRGIAAPASMRKDTGSDSPCGIIAYIVYQKDGRQGRDRRGNRVWMANYAAPYSPFGIIAYIVYQKDGRQGCDRRGNRVWMANYVATYSPYCIITLYYTNCRMRCTA
jgi:tryptophan-rich sensory protein